MGIRSKIYKSLPASVQPFAKRTYLGLMNQSTDEELRAEYIEYFFDSKREYSQYVEEFEKGPTRHLQNKAIQQYEKLTGDRNLYGVGIANAKNYYALIRKIKPESIVETGVCNGVSTLVVLLALHENESGTLYSIDYPLRADESLEEFREETFEGYGGAVIPSNKNPGWIIPDELRARWDLRIGKSQREFPKLVTELDSFGLFIHDSEHSHPCMMFEYELAYEWLDEGGIILSDDITWNDAFSVFVDVREPEHGKMSRNAGYIIK